MKLRSVFDRAAFAAAVLPVLFALDARAADPSAPPADPAAPAPTPAPAAPAPPPPETAPSGADTAPPKPEAAPSEAPAPTPAAPAPPPSSPANEPPPLAGPASEAPTTTAAPAAAPTTPPPRKPATARPEATTTDYEGGTPADAQALTQVKEQPKLNVALTWNIVLPLGKTEEFTSQVSLQGFSIEIRYRLSDRYQLGALVGWHSLSEKVYGVSSSGGVTVSGTELHEFSTNPLLARLHYFFGAAPLIGPNGRPVESKVRPYAAGGLGAARSVRATNNGILASSDEAWQLALSPEVGLIYPIAPADLLVGARLGYYVASGEFPEQMFGVLAVGAALE